MTHQDHKLHPQHRDLAHCPRQMRLDLDALRRIEGILDHELCPTSEMPPAVGGFRHVLRGMLRRG